MTSSYVTIVQYAIYVIYKFVKCGRVAVMQSGEGIDMIKAVIFDMDGTLVDTERLGIKAWKAGAAELGVAIDDALIHQFIGRTLPDVMDILDKHFGSHEPPRRSMSATRRFATRWSRPNWNLRPAPPSA